MKILLTPSKVKRLYLNLKEFLVRYSQDDIRRRQFEEFSELQMEAANIHRDTFAKYRNCNKGKNVAVIGSGPSLDKWVAPKGIVQIGVNGTCIAKNVNLDYWFVQDYDDALLSQFTERDDKLCKKFFGVHYMLPNVKPIPFSEVERFGAEQYFFYDCPIYPFPFDFTIDISSKPFITYGSTIFVALQFALFTHPDKIYIVGCDCSEGHFSLHKEMIHDKDVGSLGHIMNGWYRFQQFAQALYPDIEIISVNPVGLKGLFSEGYT